MSTYHHRHLLQNAELSDISDLNDLHWTQSTRRINTTYNEKYIAVLENLPQAEIVRYFCHVYQQFMKNTKQ